MGSSEEEQAKAQALERLQDLGLSLYEAQTLLNLIRLGTGTAQDITRINGVPRTRVYEAADRLHELGFIDVQYTTPRKYTAISTDTLIRTLNLRRENTINELSESLDAISPSEPQREEYGVWTVTGTGAVNSRVGEFIDAADEQVVYMTVDELLTDGHIEAIHSAADRDVDIYLAGISEAVQTEIQEMVPSASMFETLWEWRDTPAGRLLVTDEEVALVSALVDGEDEGIEETAIWGSGERNSLVVVLRAIFTWRLRELDD